MAPTYSNGQEMVSIYLIKIKITTKFFKFQHPVLSKDLTPYICKPFTSGFWSLKYFKYPTHLAVSQKPCEIEQFYCATVAYHVELNAFLGGCRHPANVQEKQTFSIDRIHMLTVY